MYNFNTVYFITWYWLIIYVIHLWTDFLIIFIILFVTWYSLIIRFNCASFIFIRKYLVLYAVCIKQVTLGLAMWLLTIFLYSSLRAFQAFCRCISTTLTILKNVYWISFVLLRQRRTFQNLFYIDTVVKFSISTSSWSSNL